MGDAVRLRIRVATRTTPLARAQTELVVGWLRVAQPGLEVELVLITTTGDADRSRPVEALGERGVFTKAVQRALLEDRADLAVHSLKDLPTDPVTGLSLAAVPRRADPRDVLVAGAHASLESLPRGARVGTGSARRRAQLLRRRPDLRVLPLRGSVGTRVRAVERGELDATVMARAGLDRAGLSHAISAVLQPPDFLPAPAQGALAVEVPAGRLKLARLVAKIEDRSARAATTAERAFLHELQGGCSLPAGALASPDGAELSLQAAVFGTGEHFVSRVAGAASDPVELGRRAAAEVLSLAPELRA